MNMHIVPPLAGYRDQHSKSEKRGEPVADFEYAGSGTRRAGWFRGGLLSFFLGQTRKDK